MLYQKFCYTFCFANDLIAINNEYFEKNIWNIYPAERKLEKENQINKIASFLDLTLP